MRKVFGIGVNKTGTKSTAQFVKQLGMRTLHDRPSGNNIRDAINRGKRSIPLMSSYDAFFDMPEGIDFEKLLERFPDARFIMTTRDTKQWVNSRIVHVLHNRIVSGKRSWTEIDTAAWRREKEEHENRVRETFKRLGKRDQLLIVDVCSDPDQAAQKIAEFLELPRKDIGFPRLNTGAHKLRQIQDKLNNPKPTSFAGKRGPLPIEEPELGPDSWSTRILFPVLQKVRECWDSVLKFCKSLRFQSPIVRKS